MSDAIHLIEKTIKDQKFSLPISIVRDEAIEKRFFIFVEKNKEEEYLIQEKFLDSGIKKLHEMNYSIEIILTGNDNRDAESGIRAILKKKYDDCAENCFLSIEKNSAHVWIIPKPNITKENVQDIENSIRPFLEALDLKLGRINLTTGENLPSRTALILIIRTISPAKPEDLTSILQKRGFSIPSETWLSHRLDTLRKSGFIVRLKNGSYALTALSLKILGTSRNRKSPDIARFLALARKGG